MWMLQAQSHSYASGTTAIGVNMSKIYKNILRGCSLANRGFPMTTFTTRLYPKGPRLSLRSLQSVNRLALIALLPGLLSA